MSNQDNFDFIHLAEQLDMAYQDVDRFSDNVELSEGHQRKIDYFLDEYRKRMAALPLEHQGLLGGPDGTYAIGNPEACHLSHRGSGDLPKYDPDNPHHTQVPFIVPAWNPNHEWAVRAPDTIEEIIGGFGFEAGQPCDWHFGAAKAGTQAPGVMVRAQGQLILLLHICGSCRDILDKTYANALLFFELDTHRRILIPQPGR